MTTLVIATRNAHKVQEIRALLAGRCACVSQAEFPEAPSAVEDAPTFAGNAAKKAVALANWLASNPPAGGPSLRSPVWVLADDSGLEVDALGGAPGVHSARFAALDEPAAAPAGNAPDAANNAKLLRLLANVPWEKRTARFRCVLALVPVPVPAATPPIGGVVVQIGGARPLTSPARGDARPTGKSKCTTSTGGVRELAPQLFEGTCEGRIGLAPRGRQGFGYDPLFVPAGQELSFAELGEDIKNRLSHRARALARLREQLFP